MGDVGALGPHQREGAAHTPSACVGGFTLGDMPNSPSPPGQRRWRSAKAREWERLDAPTTAPAAPPMPDGDWTTEAVEAWRSWWASPMSSVWLESDQVALRRLLRLVDRGARGKKASHTAVMQLEDRLGLSPTARMRLQWQIAPRAVSPPPPEFDRAPPTHDPRVPS